MAVSVTLSSGNVSNPETIGIESSVIGSVLSNPDLVNPGQIGPIYVAFGQGSVISSTIDGSAFVVTDTQLAVTVTGSAATNQVIAGNDVAGTTINTTTGTGTVVAGNVGTQIGLLGDQAGSGGSYTVYGGPQNDTIIASSGTNTITGSGGANLIGLSGGTNALYAAGNDTVFATGGNNLIGGGTGNSTVVASSGTNTIIGGSGTNNIFVSGGDSTVFAGAGSSQVFGLENKAILAVGAFGPGTATLAGSNSNDTLIGGTGTTGMFGGGGSNLFVFSTVFGGGQTTIRDFNAAGADNRILIQGYSGVTSASLLHNATMSGGNTVITLADNTTITVAGVTNLSSNSIVVQ